VASQRTLCIALNRDAIHAAIRADPEPAFRLLSRLAARGRHLVERLDCLSSRPVTSRLAEHLLARQSHEPGAAIADTTHHDAGAAGVATAPGPEEEAMKVARFRATGGPITCDVSPSPKRDGSYELKLWGSGENRVLQRWFGNFINTDDDRHALPSPNEDHAGRIVELVATVAVPPGTGPCTVSLVVEQDGVELMQDQGTVPPNTPAGLVNVFIQLERTP
jgi:hypothetical protein